MQRVPAPLGATSDSRTLDWYIERLFFYAGGIASIGFVGGCLVYFVLAGLAHFGRREIDLVKVSTQASFVIGVGATFFVFLWLTGLGG